MWVLGITGAIGAGKSTLAACFTELGVPVHSADQEIHSLLASDRAIQQEIHRLWPEVFREGQIDRAILGARVLSSPAALAHLEAILYSQLAQRQKEFLLRNQLLNAQFVALDVPLLFEVGLDSYCHKTLLAAAPLAVRQHRVLKRPGMTLEKFKAFASHQMKDTQREKRADFIIPCGRKRESVLKRIQAILHLLSQQPVPSWSGQWPTTFKRTAYDTGNRS